MRTEKAISTINAATEEMIQLTSQLPEELIRWKPAPEVWSIMEILCHVEELIPYWLGELTNVIKSPCTEWGRGIDDADRLAAVAQTEQRMIYDVLEGLAKTTDQVHQVLGTLKPEDLLIESPSRNPRFGMKSMEFLLAHLLEEHVAKHLGQIKRNIQQYGNLK